MTKEKNFFGALKTSLSCKVLTCKNPDVSDPDPTLERKRKPVAMGSGSLNTSKVTVYSISGSNHQISLMCINNLLKVYNFDGVPNVKISISYFYIRQKSNLCICIFWMLWRCFTLYSLVLRSKKYSFLDVLRKQTLRAYLRQQPDYVQVTYVWLSDFFSSFT